MEPLMKALEPYYHCIAPCLRGHGYSTLDKRVTNFNEYNKDIKSLMKKLKIR